MGNFGLIPYGHSIVGKVYYNLEDKQQSLGCQQISMPIPLSPRVDESPILMLDRGDCSFVTKVRNAEAIFAHVALIIDNVPNNNIEKIIMADDGRGDEISIPGVIISYEDGVIIKEYMKENKDKALIFEMIFEMENPDNTVEYDLWYTPDTESVYTLMNELYYYHKLLGKHTELRIHFVTYAKVSSDKVEKSLVKDCLGSGRYCLTPGKVGTKDGREILKEAIKQRCVYDYAYKKGETNLFWLYMITFYRECIKENDLSISCSNYATQLTKGLDSKVINQCIYNSYNATDQEKEGGDYEEYYPNTILAQDYEEKKQYYINKVPTLFINGRLFLSSWKADYVFEGLCAGLKKKPDVCFEESRLNKRDISGFTIFIVILFVLSINILFVFFCMKLIRRKIQERLDASDINQKIDTVVHSYLQMRETGS